MTKGAKKPIFILMRVNHLDEQFSQLPTNAAAVSTQAALLEMLWGKKDHSLNTALVLRLHDISITNGMIQTQIPFLSVLLIC